MGGGGDPGRLRPELSHQGQAVPRSGSSSPSTCQSNFGSTPRSRTFRRTTTPGPTIFRRRHDWPGVEDRLCGCDPGPLHAHGHRQLLVRAPRAEHDRQEALGLCSSSSSSTPWRSPSVTKNTPLPSRASSLGRGRGQRRTLVFAGWVGSRPCARRSPTRRPWTRSQRSWAWEPTVRASWSRSYTTRSSTSIPSTCPSRRLQRGQQVSVTGLVTYAQCPKRYFWSVGRPAAQTSQRSGGGGNGGPSTHRAPPAGSGSLRASIDDLYDVPEAPTGPGAFAAFSGRASPSRHATLVEAPFEIQVDNGYRVKGRIDAVYIDDGHWEIVDFKSGRAKRRPSRLVQLQAYAVAATDVDFGFPKPDDSGCDVRLPGRWAERADTPGRCRLDRSSARADIVEVDGDIEAESYPADPGELVWLL